jgi:hypothetical protein
MSSDPPELGPDRRGPDFEPPSFGQPGRPVGYDPYRRPNPALQPDRPAPRPEGPRPDRRPAYITAAVIGVVVLIVVIASIHAFRSDNQVAREEATPNSTPSPTAAASAPTNSINFTSREGSGRLTLVAHDWTRTGPRPPAYGQFLQLRVEITSTDGRISYGPQFFQTFDKSGNLFQTTEVGARQPLLGEGYLRPGQTADGWIAFDMPRGAVTLLMSNSLLESVTALRIAD